MTEPSLTVLAGTEKSYRTKRKAKRSGLFYGYWFDSSGKKLRRARLPELREAYRLWAIHRDIREGRV